MFNLTVVKSNDDEVILLKVTRIHLQEDTLYIDTETGDYQFRLHKIKYMTGGKV